MADPTYGRIDPDIQRYVEEMKPKNLGQRVAIENTLQRRRDEEMALWEPDIIEKPAAYWAALDDPPTHAYRIGWWTHRWWPRKTLLWCLLIGKQPLPAAATGSRKASRWYYARTIARRLKMIRRPHRPWQAEITVPGCSCNARRAFTADGATRRVIALHRRRMAATLEAGMPVSGVKGKCWASLTEEERATCR